jgi:hypothetical protein
VADVNGDGRPDLLTANAASSPNVSLLLGNRNAATKLQVTAPSSVTAGVLFTITVTGQTSGNGMDCLYTGRITFTSSDGAAVLPANYTFTKRDAGSHTFTVTLKTNGSQTVTATDTVTSTITGSASVTVNAPGALRPQAGSGSSRAATDSSGRPDDRGSALAAFVVADRFDSAGVAHRPGLPTVPDTDPGPSVPRLGVQVDMPATGLPWGESRITAPRLADLEAFFAADPAWDGGV